MDTPGRLPADVAGRPDVTVALPVFNGARFIAEAIDSVLAQDGWDVHVVAVDDASSDSSRAILDEYADGDARVSVIGFARNRGVAAARNAAIASRTDRLVAMIDQDDVWTADHLDVLWEALVSQPSWGFALGHQQFSPPAGTLPSWFRAEWLDGPQAGYVFGTMLAWRERGWRVVGDLNESLRHGADDTDWFIRARDLGVAHGMVPAVVLHRRIHDANASQRTSQSVPELFSVLRQRHR